MDYGAASWGLRARKVLRYTRLYGPRRTYAKLQGFLHQRRRFSMLPPSRTPWAARQQVGLIGCGNYGFSTIAHFLTQRYGRVIGGCMDIDPHRAASLSRYYGVPRHGTDASEITQDERIRLVYIASNHASHAEYAIDCLRQGQHVYIEKPHVVSQNQLDRLIREVRTSPGRVYLGFNRPHSTLGKLLRRQLERQPGPGVYNWFVAGHDLPEGHWYLHPREGGRVLGNLCHWTDFLFHLMEPHVFPVRVIPARGRASDVNIAVSYLFPDGSLATITFSEMGHTFEGVRERLSVHKGDAIAVLDDFQSLTLDVGERKRRWRSFYRDHGHRANITGAYQNAIHDEPYDRDRQIEYVANTAHLFLKTKEALEQDREIVIDAYSPSLQSAPTRARAA